MFPVPSSARQAKPPSPSRVELYRLLADADRLRILALCAEEELSVGELGTVLGESQPQVSRKIVPLRQAGLLGVRRNGTRTLLRTELGRQEEDPVVADGLAEGRRLCLSDGSLARVSEVVAAREELGVAFFHEASGSTEGGVDDAHEALHLAHLSALAPMLPSRRLAVDVGTGDGVSLDVLAPLYERVIAVDRSQARLAECAARISGRGFRNVSLFPGSFEDTALLERVDSLGGADLVFAGRTLHHASRPAQAVQSFARLLAKGGTLAILDYEPHEDESLRESQGDVWLGFSAAELSGQLVAAGLELVGAQTIPAAFHRSGPDAHLGWHAVVARRPAVPPGTPKSRNTQQRGV
jgi:DNA-binding transcriptional ArsR family regulator